MSKQRKLCWVVVVEFKCSCVSFSNLLLLQLFFLMTGQPWLSIKFLYSWRSKFWHTWWKQVGKRHIIATKLKLEQETTFMWTTIWGLLLFIHPWKRQVHSGILCTWRNARPIPTSSVNHSVRSDHCSKVWHDICNDLLVLCMQSNTLRSNAIIW